MNDSSRVRVKEKYMKVQEFQRREKVREANRKRWKIKRDECIAETRLDGQKVEGCRIVEVQTLAENLEYMNCKQTLSLKNVKKEVIKGLHSTFTIECQQCKKMNNVETAKYHEVNSFAKKHVSEKKHSNLTMNGVLGSLYAGGGCTQLNKILACLDLPRISHNLYKKYEREVGPAIEEAAKHSSRKAAAEERKLVLEKLDHLRKQL